eukprot:1710745-Pyramimonas_sp.AAC.2
MKSPLATPLSRLVGQQPTAPGSRPRPNDNLIGRGDRLLQHPHEVLHRPAFTLHNDWPMRLGRSLPVDATRAHIRCQT